VNRGSATRPARAGKRPLNANQQSDSNRKSQAKYRERKRSVRQPVEITCDCGHTFSLIPVRGGVRTKCDECRDAGYKAIRKQQLAERRAVQQGSVK